MKIRVEEPFAKLWLNRFLSDFADFQRVTQIHILLIVGCLRHPLKIGESAEKLSAIVLQKALKSEIHRLKQDLFEILD